jgi:hypothetical protein
MSFRTAGLVRMAVLTGSTANTGGSHACTEHDRHAPTIQVQHAAPCFRIARHNARAMSDYQSQKMEKQGVGCTFSQIVESRGCGEQGKVRVLDYRFGCVMQ